MGINRISALSELDKDTKLLAEEFLRRCKTAGLKVRITETYRSQERQNHLYEQGRTRPGKVVTWTRNSFHTSRRAFDICKDERGKEYDDSDGFFGKCAAIGKAIGLTCGYYWVKNQDKPHYQLDIGKTANLNLLGGDGVITKENISVNGAMVTVHVIKKENQNYVKLADLRELGLNVRYNPVKKMVEIYIPTDTNAD